MMKRLLALPVLTAAMMAASLDAATVTYRLGVDFPGTYTAGGGRATEFGGSFGGEYLAAVSDVFTAGAGFEYLPNRYLADRDSSFAFGFAPLYATGMLFPFKGGSVAPFVKLNLGYNAAYTRNDEYDVSVRGGQKLRGGLYWGAGIGAKFAPGFSADLLYSSYAAELEPQREPDDSVTYTKIGLSISYSL